MGHLACPGLARLSSGEEGVSTKARELLKGHFISFSMSQRSITQRIWRLKDLQVSRSPSLTSVPPFASPESVSPLKDGGIGEVDGFSGCFTCEQKTLCVILVLAMTPPSLEPTLVDSGGFFGRHRRTCEGWSRSYGAMSCSTNDLRFRSH